LYIEQYCTHL